MVRERSDSMRWHVDYKVTKEALWSVVCAGQERGVCLGMALSRFRPGETRHTIVTLTPWAEQKHAPSLRSHRVCSM